MKKDKLVPIRTIVLLATFWASAFQVCGQSLLTEFQFDPVSGFTNVSGTLFLYTDGNMVISTSPESGSVFTFGTVNFDLTQGDAVVDGNATSPTLDTGAFIVSPNELFLNAYFDSDNNQYEESWSLHLLSGAVVNGDGNWGPIAVPEPESILILICSFPTWWGTRKFKSVKL